MTEIRALSRVHLGSLTTERNSEDELPSIFWKFRDLTRPQWCRLRKVYYLEKGLGNRVRLRHVQVLPREDAGNDPVISIMQGPVDLDIVKAHIANANVEQALSGVRWELYGDTELTELIEQGRFDIIDLLPPDNERRSRLVREGNLSVSLSGGALDFDNFMPVHQCPICNKYKFGLDSLVFNPKWMTCGSCGYHGWNAKETYIRPVVSLLRRLGRTKHLLTAQVTEEAPVEMSFVETTATPALAQLITQCFIDMYGVYSGDLQDKLTPEKVRMLYDRSLFNLLRVETLRQAFVACMKQHFERRLVNFRAGAYRHLGMDKEVCERNIREWGESRDRFEEETELLAHLDEPLFSTKPHREYGPADSKRWTQMVKAIADFPNHLEDLLEVLLKDHCAPKETDILEVTHD